ncbi:glycosyltransferase family 2 protein [Robbsia sp. Bb-Pol-6]|uniref:Glycosyltransferase family 2 protein n=1 Tax=Robbsia betulipollinis TaxID=2981849 RepID=A0ABT3ZU87_9BURK|nr:glycosyltransferase family 2 protein [Robbsia betulipollinis]MCY0389790.1 glycosyltransferase family 2 protein [Robbsia betulipollinis]
MSAKVSTFPTFSVCICTRNRSEDLRRALLATQRSTYPIHQVVVSDDSTDAVTKEMIALEFPYIVFVEGPRRGLSANRNNIIREATGTHLLFIDDDAVLGENFFAIMAFHIQGLKINVDHVIVTGSEMTHGERVVAHRPTYLGFQAHTYRPGEKIVSTVINSAVFPAKLFEKIRFDENLIYGYEELDIAMHAVLQESYRIDWVIEAVNDHFPSQINRDYYVPFLEASRLYVTYKRYRWLEKNKSKANFFLMIAITQNVFHMLKTKRSFRGCLTATKLGLSYIRNHSAILNAKRTPTMTGIES